ncbi:MAG: MBL fold metallo-hydrolase [Nitrososphaerales archaeon]
MPYVKFFGTGAAVPSANRGFACIGLVDRNRKDIVLLDCGDGSIRKLTENHADILSISSILISHFHSDHLSGLAQIVETMGIGGRTSNLDVYGPRGLQEYFNLVEKITNVAANRKFEIRIQEVDPGQEFQISAYSVATFLMQHTLPTLGYRVKGRDFSLAYTGDTEPCPGSRELAKSVDCLIHEATFLEKDAFRARRSKHSTPKEAATNAREGLARKLFLTHVNEALETEAEMLEEARRVYADVVVANDGLEFQVP